MKRIAILHYAYPPKIGGVEVLISQHAKILSKIGYKVTIIAGFGKETDKNINFIQIPEIQSIMSFDKSLYKKIVRKGIVDEDFYLLYKNIKTKLAKILDKQDTIIIHNMTTLVHNLPFIFFIKEYAKANPQKNFLLWTHDETFIDGPRILKKKPGVNLNKFLKELLIQPIPQATYIVISQTFKKLLLKVMPIPHEKVKVIPNGIYLQRFLEIDGSIWKIIEEKNLLSSFPLIISPVNILERKNLEYSIETIFYLKKTFPKIKYIITGKPSAHRKNIEYKEKILQLIKKLNLGKNVILLGEIFKRALKDSEVHDLYDISDLIFYFSKAENFGLPILEATLAKTPIFASNLPVFEEIADDYIFKINFEKIPPAKLAQSIKKFIKTNKFLQYNYIVRTKYNLEEIVKKQLIPLL